MMICAALQLQGEECYTLQRVCAFFSIKATVVDWMMRMRSQLLLWKHCETSC